MDLDTMALRVARPRLGGAGLVARFGDVVAYVAAERGPGVATVLATCRRAAAEGGAPGDALMRAMTELLAGDAEELPGLCAVAPAQRGLAVVVFGQVEAVAHSEKAGVVRLAGSDPSTVLLRLIAGAESVTAFSAGAAAPEDDGVTDLRGGVTPGDGFLLLPAAAQAEPAAVEPAAVEPAAVEPAAVEPAVFEPSAAPPPPPPFGPGVAEPAPPAPPAAAAAPEPALSAPAVERHELDHQPGSGTLVGAASGEAVLAPLPVTPPAEVDADPLASLRRAAAPIPGSAPPPLEEPDEAAAAPTWIAEPQADHEPAQPGEPAQPAQTAEPAYQPTEASPAAAAAPEPTEAPETQEEQEEAAEASPPAGLRLEPGLRPGVTSPEPFERLEPPGAGRIFEPVSERPTVLEERDAPSTIVAPAPASSFTPPGAPRPGEAPDADRTAAPDRPLWSLGPAPGEAPAADAELAAPEAPSWPGPPPAPAPGGLPTWAAGPAPTEAPASGAAPEPAPEAAGWPGAPPAPRPASWAAEAEAETPLSPAPDAPDASDSAQAPEATAWAPTAEPAFAPPPTPFRFGPLEPADAEAAAAPFGVGGQADAPPLLAPDADGPGAAPLAPAAGGAIPPPPPPYLPAAGADADASADATLAGSAEAGGRRVQLVPGPAPEPVVVPMVVCGDGHLNPPGAEVCTVCGAGVDEGQTPSEAPRPSLGALRFDNGATFALDATVFLGRDPEADPEVADMVQRGAARALSLEDEDRTISRVHAEIRLSGWEVQAVDRSVNGTLVLPPGSSEWSRLMPQTVTPLEAGARILIGGHAFTVVERAD